jgi:hypothetical protein
MTVNRRIVIAAVLLAGAAGLSGCAGASPGTPPDHLSTSDRTAPPATTTPGAPPPTTVRTSSYDAARAQWQAGATAISAEQGKYWSQAAANLTAGETTDSDPTGYAAAVAMLSELISLPDAQQTPEQNARYHADIDALNSFFHTPGLYS